MTLVFDILNIYFSLQAFKGILLFLSFQKKKKRFGSLATLPHSSDTHGSQSSDLEKLALRLGDLQMRQKTDRDGDFTKRGPWENGACWR